LSLYGEKSKFARLPRMSFEMERNNSKNKGKTNKRKEKERQRKKSKEGKEQSWIEFSTTLLVS